MSIAGATTAIQPMAFRVLIDEAMKLTRRHFRPIYPAVAIPISLLYALFPLIQARWMRSVVATRETGPGADFSFLSGCLAFFAAIFVIVAVHTLAQTATIAAGVDALEGRSIEMSRSWRFVLAPRVLGTLVLWWLALGISFLLLFFPGIYVGLVLSLLGSVMAAEGLAGFAAMRRSAQLVRYNPQRRFLDNPKVKVFALFCIATVISWAVSALVQLPFTIAQQVMTVRGVASGQSADPAAVFERMLWLQIPSTFLGSLATMAVAIYTSFGLVLLYYDIRRRKEGVDLEAAIDRLAGAPLPAAPAPE